MEGRIEITKDQVERFIKAVESITAGDTRLSTGVEALVMAVSGPGDPGHDSIAAGLHDVADGLREVAEAIKNK